MLTSPSGWLDAQTRLRLLLYARTNDAVQPNQSYMMSGNLIEVNTRDLNRRL